jgi:hypothetical protein
MPKRIIAGLAILTGAGIALFLTSPLGRLLSQMAEPAAYSWQGKSAYARCPSGISGRSNWPQSKTQACEAMSLCANEAQLSEEQRRKLGALEQEYRCPP